MSPGPNEPILVMAMPRSGSSMVAGLFAAHGVWVGTYWPGDQWNAKGHFENVPIRNALKERFGKIVGTGEPADPVDGWRDKCLGLIRGDGYDGGPWLFKGTAMYWPLWGEFSPRWVCVRRSLDAIRSSGEASGMLRGVSDAALQAHVDALDHIRDDLGGVDVDTSALVGEGDYSTLERAFEHCGIEMDPEIVDEFIDPGLWRHG